MYPIVFFFRFICGAVKFQTLGSILRSLKEMFVLSVNRSNYEFPQVKLFENFLSLVISDSL